ncbi:MAG: bile acid beta-glucosidase [Spirulina sp. SIO3F2]|nr:bile acid beta-glucosidase [Spirulina sp. SIO3F2]
MKAFQVPRPEIPTAAGYLSFRGDQSPLPLGGLGAGGVGHSSWGGFGPWTLDAGEQIAQVLPACQFSLFEQPLDGIPQAYVLSSNLNADGEILSRWQTYPDRHCTERLLFPRSWHKYEGIFKSEIVCEQFSPFWAGCYQETSYPVGVFNWTFHNPTDEPITLSLMLTWQNMVGWFTNADKQTPGRYQPKWQESTGNFNQWITDHFRVGCLFNRVRLYDELQEGEGQMAIASITNPALEVYHIGRWNPEHDGGEVWDWFARNGMLPDQQDETPAEPGEQVASALAIRFTVRPGRGKKIPFFLAWDFPVMEFAPGVTYFQRHSDFFARTGNNAWTVVRTALKHSDVWREKIMAWQRPLLERKDIPDWLPAVLCNGLAQLVDGGTIWTAGTETDPIGQFARINCHVDDQPCYEHLQARLVDSFVLVMLLPRLDKAVLETYARAINPTGTVPEHLGSPRHHPWQQVGIAQDVSPTAARGRASAFVVQVYRDYVLTGVTDSEFLWECWCAIAQALELEVGADSVNPLWPVALAAAVKIGQAIADAPPMNPALEPETYPESILNQIKQYETQLQQITETPKNQETIVAAFYAQILGLEAQVGDRISIQFAQDFAHHLPNDVSTELGLLSAAYLLSQGETETAWAIAEKYKASRAASLVYWILYGVLTDFKTA